MNPVELKHLINQTIKKKLKEMSEVDNRPPRSLSDFMKRLEMALHKSRAPIALIESVCSQDDEVFNCIHETWENIDSELSIATEEETHQVWSEVVDFYVRDMMIELMQLNGIPRRDKLTESVVKVLLK
jgi:glycyl-tRNA synthetase beta subunit